MIRRGTGVALRLLAAFGAGLAVLAALLALRLASGPVSLDILAPLAARALAGADSDVAVRVDHALLSFGRNGELDLVARGVHLRQRDGEAQLLLPELSLGLGSRALLRGMVAPTRIVVVRPDLRLRRDAAGAFHLGLGGAEGATSEDWGARLLHDIAAPPGGAGPLGYLREVAVRDATLTVDDQSLGIVWDAQPLGARLQRDADGLSGALALSVQVAGRRSDLHGSIRYRATSGSLSVALDFDGLRPATWAGAAAALAPLAAIDLPVSGRVRLDLDAGALRIRDASADLRLGAGAIRHPALVDGEMAVAAGDLRAAYDPTAGRVTVEAATLDLGGPRIEVSGTADGIGDDLLAGKWPQALDIAGTVRASALPVDAFARLWPEGLAHATRDWVVTHIHDGVVEAAAAQLVLHLDLPPDAPTVAHLTRFDGRLAYRGLTVDYFTPLAPVRGVDGTAGFDRAHIDFLPTSGVVKGVKVTGGRVHLYALDTNDEQAAIEVAMRGPLGDVLEVLDTKPLGYAHDLGVDPSQVVGDSEARVTFAFPLKHDLRFAQVDFGATAHLAGVGIGNAMFGRDLTAGDFSLKLDRAALRLNGTAELAGVPMTLDWTHSLKPGDAVRTRYAVRARLDEAARQAVGLDLFPDALHGPVGVDLVYAVRARQQAQATVALDLTPARVALGELGWTKRAGVPATARLDLDFVGEKLTTVRDAVVKGGGIDARLSAAFGAVGAERGLTSIDVRRLIVGETDAAGTVRRRPEGGWQVKLSGLSFDASGLMAAEKRAPDEAAPGPPLVIEAQLDRLVLGPKREARHVSGELFSDGRHWQAASIDASLIGGGKATLRFGAVGGERSFHLVADDFGALLRLFDISDNVAGGRLEIDGKVEDVGATRRLRGSVEGADYRIVGAPLFARLLSVASFSGIGGLLSGEGIPFTRLMGDFVYGAGRVDFQNLRAYGGAIGVNAGGRVDLRMNTLDVSGTLVPAYTINSILGTIPMLGKLLLGGEGQGIFGANFRVAGSLADPGISVNPLSALAPGFLRQLFLFEPGDPSKPPSATPPAASTSQ